jgi:CysZ protein
MTAPSRPARDFVTGIGMLGKGIATYGRSPGLLLLGLLPAFISFALLFTGFVFVLYFIGPEARAATWFASGWPEGLRELVRALAAVAIIVAFVFLSFIFYVGLTLAIGDPFYEKISVRVEDRLGGVPNAVNLPWWKEIRRSIGEALRLLVFSVVVAVLVFAVGLLPVAGQIAGPVIGALVGGWALAVELTGIAFARRGVRLRERRRILRGRRWLALGFGVSVFVCFLIPLGAILVMPAAVAGATLLTRHVYGLPT